MSYNQAYEQDSGENVSYNSLYSLDVNNRRNTLLPVIKSSQVTPPPPPPPLSLLRTQKLQVASSNYGALNAILSGVLQTTATFKINITELDNVASIISINGTSAAGVARKMVLFIMGFNGTSINFLVGGGYNSRGYFSGAFTINKNEMFLLGYRIEADGAVRVFINGTRVNGGNFNEQNAPLAPIDSVQTFDVITRLECTLGDIAYYDVAKSDAFLEDVENYNINPTEPNLILGWREGTLIDVVNNIPLVIV